MGIEHFFSSFAKNEFAQNNGIVTNLSSPIEGNNLYIDFNSIIYNIGTEIERDINYVLYALLIKKMDQDSEKILEKWKIKSGEISLENFEEITKKYVTTETIINRIIDYIIDLTTKYISQGTLKMLYISFDGIPNMGKIHEQKKRRYTNAILSILKNKIFETEIGNISEYRKIYEEKKYSFDRSIISSSNPFMEIVYNRLTDKAFQTLLITKVSSLEKYEVSGPHIYGEGEKKIMEEILADKRKGINIIYSPDADLIILCMIMMASLELRGTKANFRILRHNQQTNQIDFINANVIVDNIYEHIKNTSGNEYNKNNVVLDIAFLFTVFGNDFVPKIECIDVKKDVLQLINIYIELLKSDNTDMYIIFYQEKKFKIRYTKMIHLIFLLEKIEINNLRDVYIQKTYGNGGRLRKIFDGKIYENLMMYTKISNTVYEHIVNVKKQKRVGEEFDRLIDKLTQNYSSEILKKYVEHYFLLEKHSLQSENNFMTDMKHIFNYLRNKQVLPSLKLFDAIDNVEDEFHSTSIKNMLPHPEMDISSYDKKCYMLEKKMGEYKEILNAKHPQYGRVSVDIVNNTFYRVSSLRPKESLDIYYRELYDKSYDTSTFEGRNKINKIAKEYIKGIFWVFDFYFNRNNYSENVTSISTWFYEHHTAPLLYSLTEYLKQKTIDHLDELMEEITKGNYVPRDKFLNKYEHTIYINPKDKIKEVLPCYKDLIESNLFPDINVIANKIFSKESNLYIDCRNASYFSKCYLPTLPVVSYHKFISLIKDRCKDIHSQKVFSIQIKKK